MQMGPTRRQPMWCGAAARGLFE